MHKAASALAALALVGASALPASALEFSHSSTTGKSAFMLPFRSETPRIGPISVDLGVRVAPALSDILGPSNLNAGYTEATSMLFDASANAYYHIQLADIELLGRFNPVVAPYVGARYMGSPTVEGQLNLSSAGSAVSYSQFTGLNYGVRAYTELPLGFNAYANAGLTTLLSGGWDTRQNGTNVTGSGHVGVGGTTLPSLGLGAGWNFYNLVALSVGYEILSLPTALRTHGASLTGGQTSLNTLTVGLRLLFISI